MGKKLIIKGADFSENAAFVDKWYNSYNNLQGNNLSVGTIVADPVAIETLGLYSKPINKIKLYASTAKENISIGVCQITGSRESNTISITKNTDTVQSFNVSEGENTIELENEIIISEGQSIFFERTTNCLQVINDGSSELLTDSGWSYATYGSNTQWFAPRYKIPIMFGYKG